MAIYKALDIEDQGVITRNIIYWNLENICYKPEVNTKIITWVRNKYKDAEILAYANPKNINKKIKDEIVKRSVKFVAVKRDTKMDRSMDTDVIIQVDMATTAGHAFKNGKNYHFVKITNDIDFIVDFDFLKILNHQITVVTQKTVSEQLLSTLNFPIVYMPDFNNLKARKENKKWEHWTEISKMENFNSDKRSKPKKLNHRNSVNKVNTKFEDKSMKMKQKPRRKKGSTNKGNRGKNQSIHEQLPTIKKTKLPKLKKYSEKVGSILDSLILCKMCYEEFDTKEKLDDHLKSWMR